MCGIFGAIASEDVAPKIFDGLRRLEYRGYDGSGMAVVTRDGVIARRRASGGLEELSALLARRPISGRAGIGHTRWATHGPAVTANAHPHVTARVAVVHNGIVENQAALRRELVARGVRFESDTDTEIVARLLTDHLENGASASDAIRETLAVLRGRGAFACVFAGVDDAIAFACRGASLVLGFGEDVACVASDTLALRSFVERIVRLEDGDTGFLGKHGAETFDAFGARVERASQAFEASKARIDKDGHRHFMAKEIHEQPAVLARVHDAYVDAGTGAVRLPDCSVDLRRIERVTLVACGTARFAAQVGRNWLERHARVPAEVAIASEFRCRDMPPDGRRLVVLVSQSGETADTLAALTRCKEEGLPVVGVVNVTDSSIARGVDWLLPTHAGPEIGVASTKAFTAQLAVLACLALGMGRIRGVLTAEGESDLSEALRDAPRAAENILASEDGLASVVDSFADASGALFMGRGDMVPLAFEGALKLKEVAYVHAEGFAAGELKHGPIALVDDRVPVVAIAPCDSLFDKTASNTAEVMARGARVVMLSDSGGFDRMGPGRRVDLRMPRTHSFVAPILYALPLQMLAYHVALARGTSVDRPRNLAKSVTVE